MRDIKERVKDKNPKIRNPAARLPKELVRSAVLEAKEKPRELHEKSSGQSDSPTQYGTEKIESVQYISTPSDAADQTAADCIS